MTARAFALAIAVALSFADCEAVAGQTERSDLTLEEALDLAAVHNPAYQRAVNDMSLAQPRSRRAWGAFLPSLDLRAGTDYGFNERSVGTDNFGNPIPNPQVQRIWNSQSNQGLGFGVQLFEGGRRFYGLSEARARADATTWAARSALAIAQAEIQRQFLLAQLAEEFLALEDELLAARRVDLTVTVRLFEIATRSQSDVLGAELEVQRQERQRESQQAERAKAMVALRAAIGDPQLEIAGVASRPIRPLDPIRLDISTLVDRALSNRPEVHQGAADVDVAHASLRMAKSSRWPSIGLNGGYSRASAGVDRDFLFDLNPDASKFGSLSLTVSLPLFQRFETSANIAEAEVARDNANETLREIELNTERDVRQSMIDLESRFRALELSAAERDLAERRLRLVREEYRLAVKDFSELQSAIREEADSRRAEVQARYDYANALIALEERIGGPVTPAGTN